METPSDIEILEEFFKQVDNAKKSFKVLVESNIECKEKILKLQEKINDLEQEKDEAEEALAEIKTKTNCAYDMEIIKTLEDELKMDLIKEVFSKYTLSEFEQRLK